MMILISIFAVIFIFFMFGQFIWSDNKTFEEKNIEKSLKESISIIKELKNMDFEMRDLLQIDYNENTIPRLYFSKILKTKEDLYNYIIENKTSSFFGVQLINFLTNKDDTPFGISHKLYDIPYCINKLKETEGSKYMILYLSMFSQYYYSDECQTYIKKELRINKLERIIEL